ncbi:MAG: hypothetical protein LQ346_003027 [Caloplaca aetnensis]|nr:MAG: hypothetical protein LQ346_003027 [Caloplaca aetnensis]
MADVRSMLRIERASRRITHQHLSYSSTGTLICLVCNIQVKAEALWNKHLNSTLHGTNARKSREPTSQEATAPRIRSKHSSGTSNSKKRKADDESSDEETRKRTRAGDQAVLDGFVPQKDKSTSYNSIKSTVNETSDKQPAPPTDSDPTIHGIPSHPRHSTTQPKSAPTVDEDEWAAFQREIATPAIEPTALTAAADIVSAPLTAAELAAQSREQASRQAKERLEAEVEGEKEDAARQLEEEFDEMAELEDRVRRLREKREQLRMKEKQEGVAVREESPDPRVDHGDASDVESSDDNEEDGWGVWGR